jgi:hypothetical protein
MNEEAQGRPGVISGGAETSGLAEWVGQVNLQPGGQAADVCGTADFRADGDAARGWSIRSIGVIKGDDQNDKSDEKRKVDEDLAEVDSR